MLNRSTPSISHLSLGLAAFAAALWLSGCGNTKPVPPEALPGASPVKVDEGTGDLAELSKALKTHEDSLILDLLAGYRMLVVRNPDAQNLDKATLQRSRAAYERLEFLLRHGGVKAQEGGERIFSIQNEDKLSLQKKVIGSASQAGRKAEKEGDWDRARARWREIVQSKQAVAWTMDEAQWGLTLADALDSPIPDDVKKKLKNLNESYNAEISQDEISRQVKELLQATIKDEKLRRELKKLANRAWERDRRAGRVTEAAPANTPLDSAPPSAVAGFLPPAGSETPGPRVQEPLADGAGAPEEDLVKAQVDTLSGQGRYIVALKMLDRAAEKGDKPWIKEKKAQIGDRYCEEKRRSAALSFKDFTNAAAAADKRNHLKRTASDLDSCLFYFPDLAVSAKVRKNRERVEAEMKKLKP